MRFLNPVEAAKTTLVAVGTQVGPIGTVAAIWDPTYGSQRAVYCYIQDAVTTANNSPVFTDPTSGRWYVDEDENETSVVGQQFCVGGFLCSPVNAAAAYGWVLTAGYNNLAGVSDGTVDAGCVVYPSDTDGTWLGVASTLAGAATAPAIFYGGYKVGVCEVADTSNVVAAGSIMYGSVWGNLPVTLC